ncbi:DNA glycosylase [Syncephalastrum racemosum]|uniref:Adenine DNA glycosylase n=1 Tax=Syncephalastrum racemosum TaxID=13706 RepID=A0A1X2HU96_SYNRA|nr:DNA glycosylase [Syncephalastrum racemosum]
MTLEQSVLHDIEECVASRRLHHSTSYHDISQSDKDAIRSQLLAWYDKEKRTNMPWRKPTIDSLDREILSQRAYEVTVIQYYNRWMKAFPTIHDLARAEIEQVNTLWAGLGYYSRARRLWEGAQKVVNEMEGHLPNNARDLQAQIPGVGRYTAGAVASIVFGERTPAVDGNVIRVLSRWRAIGADPKKANTVELIWDLAGQAVDDARPGDFNQAIMELGARICTPQNPDCDGCPLKSSCRATAQLETQKRTASASFLASDRPTTAKRKRQIEHSCNYCPPQDADLTTEDYLVTRYPFKPEKKAPRNEECAVCILRGSMNLDDEPRYLISKRPDTGLLAGLWEFPSLELASLETAYHDRAKQTTDFLRARYGIDVSKLDNVTRQDLGSVVHLFSHIRKVYHLELLSFTSDKAQIMMDEKSSDNKSVKWMALSEIKEAPIPTGLKKAIKVLESVG